MGLPAFEAVTVANCCVPPQLCPTVKSFHCNLPVEPAPATRILGLSFLKARLTHTAACGPAWRQQEKTLYRQHQSLTSSQHQLFSIAGLLQLRGHGALAHPCCLCSVEREATAAQPVRGTQDTLQVTCERCAIERVKSHK